MPIFAYPAAARQIAPDDFEIVFRDVPEVVTGGPTLEAAFAEAPDALEAALEAYVGRGRPLPRPSPAQEGERLIALPVPLAARALLEAIMTDRGLSKVAVAQAMGKDEKVVRRILGGDGASAELTLSALAAIGERPTLQPQSAVGGILDTLIDVELRLQQLHDDLLEPKGVHTVEANAARESLRSAMGQLQSVRRVI